MHGIARRARVAGPVMREQRKQRFRPTLRAHQLLSAPREMLPEGGRSRLVAAKTGI